VLCCKSSITTFWH